MTIDSKAAIPWGNTFNYVAPLTGAFEFNWNPSGSGQSVLPNRALAPVDANFNPDGSGYMADLLEGSTDPAKLTVYYGVNLTHRMPYPLVAGNTYTVSCWIKPAYLAGESAVISLLGSGNWTTGLQTQGSEGDFSHASLKFLNGSVTIVQAAVTGSYGSIGDLGIPKDIPTERLLFSRPGDHIRSVSTNASTPMLVMDPVTRHEAVYDLSTASGLTPLLNGIKNSTLFYQEIMPASTCHSVQLDAWMRVAQETINNGVVTINPAVTGSVTGLAVVYTDTQGRQIVQVYQSYLTITTSWRLQFQGLTAVPAGTNYPARDMTKPIGYGFFFTGDLAVYGGIRLQDNTTLASANVVLGSLVNYTRLSFTFTAPVSMQNTLHATALPGFQIPLVFDDGYITISITAYQPGQPKIGGINDPAYLPWTPYWASVYLYGLWINDGNTAGVYQIDPPVPVAIGLAIGQPSFKGYLPSLKVPAAQTQTMSLPPPPLPQPSHNVGLNIGGNTWFSVTMSFLNLAKMCSFSRYRAGIDPTGVVHPRPQCGWHLYSSAHFTWDTMGSRLSLTGVAFTLGNSFFTVPIADNPTWTTFDAGWYDKHLIGGPHIPTGMTVTASAVALNPLLARFTTSIPFDTNSLDDPTVATSTYQIKRHSADDPSDLALNANGYPTVIPSGYIPYGMAYRNTAAYEFAAFQMHNPFLPSGHYILKWDGTGSATIAQNVGASPGGFPVTELSRTSHRAVFDVDCSGKTATGADVQLKYYLSTDSDAHLAMETRCGFFIAITATDAQDPLRNIRLVEERYESLLDAGEIWYPEWIDRVADYKTLRFLDWTQTNSFYPYVYDIDQKPNVDDISYASKYSHVPWEIVIAFCNRTHKNCWINLHPASPDDLVTWVATLFRDNLDPRLRIYAEFGNEPWNGGMTGYYFGLYAEHYNIVGDPLSANPAWSNMEKAYAMLSQQAFTIWESVFAGYKGLLQPTRLSDPPKLQKRRLVRVCSLNDGGWVNAEDIFGYARPYCTNGHGIPYDAVASNLYNNAMLGPVVQQAEASVAPALYQWTLDETIALAWQGLADQLANCAILHHACQTNQRPSYGGTWGPANSFLGVDDDGDPIQVAHCMYEGGFGSPGASPYMYINLAKLKFEEDGSLHTVYNYYKNMLNWWNNEVATDGTRNQDVMMYNIWEAPKNWTNADQWGVADKSFYPRWQYNNFPIQRAVAESAGELLPTLVAGPGLGYTPQPSRPEVIINGAWVPMSNIRIKGIDGQWHLIPAPELKYTMTGQWF